MVTIYVSSGSNKYSFFHMDAPLSDDLIASLAPILTLPPGCDPPAALRKLMDEFKFGEWLDDKEEVERRMPEGTVLVDHYVDRPGVWMFFEMIDFIICDDPHCPCNFPDYMYKAVMYKRAFGGIEVARRCPVWRDEEYNRDKNLIGFCVRRDDGEGHTINPHLIIPPTLFMELLNRCNGDKRRTFEYIVRAIGSELPIDYLPKSERSQRLPHQ